MVTQVNTKDVCMDLIDKMGGGFRFIHTADNDLWIVTECKLNKALRQFRGRCMQTLFTVPCMKKHLENMVHLHGINASPLNFCVRTYSSEGTKKVMVSDSNEPYQEILSCLIKVITHARDRVMIRFAFTPEIMLRYLRHASPGTIKSQAKVYRLAPKEIAPICTVEKVKAAKLTSTEDELVFDYVNHRGEKGERRVRPTGPIYFGSTEFHKEGQWLMEAWDLDKDATRVFALKDIIAYR